MYRRIRLRVGTFQGEWYQTPALKLFTCRHFLMLSDSLYTVRSLCKSIQERSFYDPAQFEETYR